MNIQQNQVGLLLWLDLLSPHILPLCYELYRILGDSFYIVFLKETSEKRLSLGWSSADCSNLPLLSFSDTASTRLAFQSILHCQHKASIFQGLRCDKLFPGARLLAMRHGHRIFLYQEQLRLHSFDGFVRSTIYTLFLRLKIPSTTTILAIGGMANKKFLSLLNRYSVYEFAYFSLVVESLRKTRFSAFSSTEIRCRDLDALPVRILYLGQLIKRKGVDILIESLKSIGSSSFTLTICGNGKLLPNVLESTSADSRVNYIRPIPIDKVAILISEHDIIVAPSRYDGWGSVVVEALAAGKRVITTATTGSSCLVTFNQAGSVLSSLRASSLSQAIISEIAYVLKHRYTNKSPAEYVYPTASLGAQYLISIILRCSTIKQNGRHCINKPPWLSMP